ncbi:MAG TPA: BON domain-containing protein [Gemmatimonadaceae bacterium]|nr:BON domain-containing protein [Gemmatimonadaceae bacterium]
MSTNRDATLEYDARNALQWSPNLTTHGVRVAVHDGIATLRGWVLTDAARDAAVRAVRRVRGIWATQVEIDVKDSGIEQQAATPSRAWSAEMADAIWAALEGRATP